MENTKTWTREEVRSRLETSDRWVERAIVALFEQQTLDEKRASVTNHRNNVGFNATDAFRGSYYARWINSGMHLTGRHLATARRMVLKYAGQLAVLANEKSAK